MPLLQNARHELFAQKLAEGKAAAEAYRLAGYRDNDGNAAVLKGNQRVQERVSELLSTAQERTLVTIESITQELEAARILAMADERGASAAVAASMGKAKLHGLLVDRAQSTSMVQIISDEPMTEDEWIAAYSSKVEASR